MLDARGVPTSAVHSKSLERFEQALRALNVYRGDPVQMMDACLAEDPDFAMGHVLRAEVLVTMWEGSVLPEIRRSLERLEALDDACHDRERRHTALIRHWTKGDWNAMRHELDHLLADYPRDLLALQLGHLADFYHGDRDNLRTRIARALPVWSRDDLGYSFLQGMLAFGLEECGLHELAEEAGRLALDLQPEDCWAHHAVTHVLEMQARQAEGVALMESRRASYAQPDNVFAFHNHWHHALFCLDQGATSRALELYDRDVHPKPTEVQLMLVDGASLLWRFHLRGLDVRGRFEEVADAYERAGEAGFYVFNDMHAMMAYVAAEREDAQRDLMARVEAAAREAGANGGMTRDVGLRLVHGVWSFGRGDYEEALNQLLPVRFRAHACGGSHAQRDVIHQTVIEAAIRGGKRSLAQALTNERTALKPGCPFTWKLHARAREMPTASYVPPA